MSQQLQFYNNSQIQSILRGLRKDQDDIDDIEIHSKKKINEKVESQKSRLLEMGATLEKLFLENGMEMMIPNISEIIISMLQKNALDNLINVCSHVLPDKYKQSEKSRKIIKTYNSTDVLDSLKENTEQNIADKFSNLEKGDIKAAHELLLQQIKKVEEIAEQKEESLLPDDREDGTYSALGELDRIQEEKFSEKASISPSLPPNLKPGQSTADYEKEMARLSETFSEYVDIAHDVAKFFTEQYPPTDLDTLKALTDAVTTWNRGFRPYVDDKYRRDWIQWRDIIIKKLSVSATNASKESGIECAYSVDPKTGRPIIRKVTKEQIDSMYVENWNYLIDLINQLFILVAMSDAYAENAARCREDRAVKLAPKLQFLS